MATIEEDDSFFADAMWTYDGSPDSTSSGPDDACLEKTAPDDCISVSSEEEITDDVDHNVSELGKQQTTPLTEADDPSMPIKDTTPEHATPALDANGCQQHNDGLDFCKHPTALAPHSDSSSTELHLIQQQQFTNQAEYQLMRLNKYRYGMHVYHESPLPSRMQVNSMSAPSCVVKALGSAKRRRGEDAVHLEKAKKSRKLAPFAMESSKGSQQNSARDWFIDGKAANNSTAKGYGFEMEEKDSGNEKGHDVTGKNVWLSGSGSTQVHRSLNFAATVRDAVAAVMQLIRWRFGKN